MADISTIPLVNVPFADFDSQKVTDIDFLKSGVQTSMTAPTQNGGTVFTRAHLNGIGYFATLGAFLDRIGYPYGIRRDSSADFGGYPKGAILISEDDDYVREYVSQIDNNMQPLPSEAADGTYEGNEYWKPTLPTITDFYPDFTTYVSKTSISIDGTGTKTYTPDEDGWYQFFLNFSDSYWPKEATLNNKLGTSSCSVLAGDAEICRLDGRFAVYRKIKDASRSLPSVTALVPLSKGKSIAFNYKLPSEKGYTATILIRRWGISSI